jgi:mannosyltransferase OCH1-like enzyme
MNCNTFTDFLELDQYLLSQDRMIIHQIWFGTIPNRMAASQTFKKLKSCRESWSLLNPNLLHMIWNKTQVIDLIKTYYSEFYELFHTYKYEIQRCDFARYCILHRYGGMYVDMDYKCKKPFEQVFLEWNQQDVYCVETPNSINEHTMVSNSLMISYTREHLFWKMLLLEMNKAIDKYKESSKHIQVMYTTGPAILYKVFHIYKFRYKLGILPAKYFHPLSLNNREIDQDSEAHIFAVHMGFSSWCSTDSEFLILLYQNYKIIFFIVLVLVVPQVLIKIIQT